MKIGDIVKEDDGYYEVTQINPTNPNKYRSIPIDTEDSAAGILERGQAGLAQDTPESKLAAWQSIRGAENVKQADDGAVFVLDGGKWQPVEGEGITDIVGDVADYSGDLVEDIGAGVGAALGGAAGMASPMPGGTLAGVSGGGGVGRGVGNVARQTLSKIAGVDSGEEPALSQVGGAALQGAIEEPLALAGGKVLSEVGQAAKPFIESVVQAPIKWGTSALAGALTAKNPELVSKLTEEGGEALLKKARAGYKGLEEGTKAAIGLPNALEARASIRYIDELGGSGLDLDVPADLTDIKQTLIDIVDELDVYKYVDNGGVVYSKNTPLDKVEADFLTVDIPEILETEMATADKAFAFKKALKDKLTKAQYWTKPSSDKTQFEHALKRLYDGADSVVQRAAVAQGKGQEYDAAKASYGERMNVVNNMRQFIKGGSTKAEKGTQSVIGRIEAQNMGAVLEDLNKAVELEPDLQPLLDEVLLTSRGGRLAGVIPSLGTSRTGKSILDSISDPVFRTATVLATHPKSAFPAMVQSGKAGRKLSDVAGAAVRGADSQIGRELTRIAAPNINERDQPRQLPDFAEYRPQPDPNEFGQSLLDFAKSRYSNNYKTAVDSGLDEQAAARKVAADLISKGKANKVSQGLGLTDAQALSLLGGN